MSRSPNVDGGQGLGPHVANRRHYVIGVSNLQFPRAALSPHQHHHKPAMNVLVLLSLLLFIPFLFFLAFLAASSCMGDGFRARFAGVTFNPRNASFGRNYTRGMGAGSGGWEQIEMEDMMGEDSDSE